MISPRNWWQIFIYNYRWSDYVAYIDGWIPKLSLSVSIIGYLILFNDKISEILIFKELANEDSFQFGLSGIQRLRLLYFGLIFLGVSNIIYRFKKPYQFKFGTNLIDYTRTCLEIYTLSDYIDINGTIQSEGHFTLSGKYPDSEWDGFLEASKTTGKGTENVTRDGDWEGAKRKYGGLLRGILSEYYFRYDIGKRFWLSLCFFLSTFGYLMLLAPSVDLFAKVLISTLGISV